MSKLQKILGGGVFWTVSTYIFAYWAHIAPEGQYAGMGSSLEAFSLLFAFAYFFGIPVLTGFWFFYDD